MNKVVLIGRLVRDVELKFTPGNGTAVANFTIAVDRRFTKGQEKETDFVPIVAFTKIAENTANYTHKGSLVGVAGRLQVRNYDAKDGTKRYVTEIIADEVQFLDSKKDSAQGGQERNQTGYESFGKDITPIDDDGEIPF